MNTPIDEIIRKWEHTGLLEELSSDKKVRCAISLETMASILLEEKSKQLNEVNGKSSEDIAATILPIVRKLYNENIELMPTMQSLYEDYIGFIKGDMEAFLCEAYVKDLVHRLPGNN